MAETIQHQCQLNISALQAVISSLKEPRLGPGKVHQTQVQDELERFSLWVGNIGALHPSESQLSVESRLSEATEVLFHINDLLSDLRETSLQLFEITSGAREGKNALRDVVDQHDNLQQSDALYEETELYQQLTECVTRLFRVSILIRNAAPSDPFIKALSRDRYRYNDQFDIAHVGQKYPKTMETKNHWLQVRLGRAITQRRHYLHYIRDHRDKLAGELNQVETRDQGFAQPQAYHQHLEQKTLLVKTFDIASRPSTFVTKASSITPGQISDSILAAAVEQSDDGDAKSYTTISRSVKDDIGSSITTRIPALDTLRAGPKNEFECPFCFNIKRFKHEHHWKLHVFADLRSYICTFPECDASYFTDINDWFNHEMQNHRYVYSCMMCKSRQFRSKDGYLTHIRKHHPELLEIGEEESFLKIGRTPMDQIPAIDCPCCSDWADRLAWDMQPQEGAGEAIDTILMVQPTMFKRHLASHLEQLALFAVPINSSSEETADSNAAIENVEDDSAAQTDTSPLNFHSPSNSIRSPVEPQLRTQPSSVSLGASSSDSISVGIIGRFCRILANIDADAGMASWSPERFIIYDHKFEDGHFVYKLRDEITGKDYLEGEWVSGSKIRTEAGFASKNQYLLEPASTHSPQKPESIGNDEERLRNPIFWFCCSCGDFQESMLRNPSCSVCGHIACDDCLEDSRVSDGDGGDTHGYQRFEPPRLFIAIVDRIASGFGHLSFNLGQVIKATSKTNNYYYGYYKDGELEEHRGIFPQSCVVSVDVSMDQDKIKQEEDKITTEMEIRTGSPTQETETTPPPDPPLFLKIISSDITYKFQKLEDRQQSRLAQFSTSVHTPTKDAHTNIPFPFNQIRIHKANEEDDQISASYIKLMQSNGVLKEYVITRYPETEDEPDFWRMVVLNPAWSDTSSLIVLLNDVTDKDTLKEVPYIPQWNRPIKFQSEVENISGCVHGHVLSEAEWFEGRGIVRTDLTINYTDLRYGSGLQNVASTYEHGVVHMQFCTPLIFDVASNVTLQADFAEFVRQTQSAALGRHPIVHCNTNIGKTGVFIALDWLLSELHDGAMEPGNDTYGNRDPIFDVVDDLRKQRMMMVKTEAQYKFLYETLLTEWRRKYEAADTSAD